MVLKTAVRLLACVFVCTAREFFHDFGNPRPEPHERNPPPLQNGVPHGNSPPFQGLGLGPHGHPPPFQGWNPHGNYSSFNPEEPPRLPGSVYNFGPLLAQVTEPLDHGEGPAWDPRTQQLYFVDLFKGIIHSLNPLTMQRKSIEFQGASANVVLPSIIPNRLVAGINRDLVLIDFTTNSSYGPLSRVEADKTGNRFNDGKTDVAGRAWIGTIGPQNSSGVVPEEANLYKFTRSDLQNPEVEISNVSISNGLAWSRDNKKFFYIDSPTRQVVSYDFDAFQGEISNEEVVFDFDTYEIAGVPDGMTIDSQDNLFIATYGGGEILKVNPKTKQLLKIYGIPARDVTSATFGGADLDILFVTTSRHDLTPAERQQYPVAGAVFAIFNTGSVGLPVYYTNIIEGAHYERTYEY